MILIDQERRLDEYCMGVFEDSCRKQRIFQCQGNLNHFHVKRLEFNCSIIAKKTPRQGQKLENLQWFINAIVKGNGTSIHPLCNFYVTHLRTFTIMPNPPLPNRIVLHRPQLPTDTEKSKVPVEQVLVTPERHNLNASINQSFHLIHEKNQEHVWMRKEYEMCKIPDTTLLQIDTGAE
jgi:hypothetical protein